MPASKPEVLLTCGDPVPIFAQVPSSQKVPDGVIALMRESGGVSPAALFAGPACLRLLSTGAILRGARRPGSFAPSAL